jgi:hypothetical protein
VFLPQREALEALMTAEHSRHVTHLRAGAFATSMTALLGAGILIGSRNLQNFDAALVIYTFATIFMVWGVAYHYFVWLEKPPTQLYWRRTWDLLRRQGIAGLILAAKNTVTHVALQTFIARRSHARWYMHQLIFWGCVLAVAITFPLVFGWVHFRSAPNDQMTYVTYVFGFAIAQFKIRTVFSWIVFHGLDIAAVLVLAGVFLAIWRRLRDQGAQAVQSFAMDFFPLILLTAISLTGLALTASTTWLRGSFYDFLSILHCRHRRGGASISAVWKVLPHLPTPRSVGCETVSGGRRQRSRRPVRPLRPALCFANAHRRSQDCASPAEFRLFAFGFPNLARRVSVMQAEVTRDKSIAFEIGVGGTGQM